MVFPACCHLLVPVFLLFSLLFTHFTHVTIIHLVVFSLCSYFGSGLDSGRAWLLVFGCAVDTLSLSLSLSPFITRHWGRWRFNCSSFLRVWSIIALLHKVGKLLRIYSLASQSRMPRCSLCWFTCCSPSEIHIYTHVALEEFNCAVIKLIHYWQIVIFILYCSLFLSNYALFVPAWFHFYRCMHACVCTVWMLFLWDLFVL